jgi:hypothetical protein
MGTILNLFSVLLRKLTPAEVDANFTNLRTTADAAAVAVAAKCPVAGPGSSQAFATGPLTVTGDVTADSFKNNAADPYPNIGATTLRTVAVGAVAVHALESYHTTPNTQIRARSAGGTPASPTATPLGATLYGIYCMGWNGTAAWTSGAYMRFFASELWSPTTKGTTFDITTTVMGTNAVSTRLRSDTSGNLILNGDGIGNVLIGPATDDGANRLQVAGPIRFQPAAAATPPNNGDLVFEATSNTALKIKFKGSDGAVRSATLTLA